MIFFHANEGSSIFGDASDIVLHVGEAVVVVVVVVVVWMEAFKTIFLAVAAAADGRGIGIQHSTAVSELVSLK